MKIILKIVLLALAIFALPYLNFISTVHITVTSFYSALIVALVLSGINLVVKPVITLVTLPINVITLGVFGLVINGALLWFVASFVQGFTIANFLTAFIAALAISIVNWLLHIIL